jgi:outer membrane protein TolC
MNIKLHIITSVIIVSVSIAAVSTYAEEEIFTLDTALVTAYENNPRMTEARKSVEAVKGDSITARVLPNPEVEFEIGGLKKNEDGKRRTNLDKVGVKQEFEPFGVRGLKSKIARNEILIQEESVRAVWSEIYLKVRENYNKIILDKKQMELASDNLNILRQFYSRVEIRFQSGKAIKNELQRAKIELLEAEAGYLNAEKEFKVDKAKLNLLLGRAVDTPFDIKEELKEEELELDFKELTERAFTQRPDIKQEELSLDSKVKNLTKEQLSRLPSPFVGFERTTTDYENDSAITIGMSLPLWDLNQGEVKKAKAEKEAQKVKVESVKREVVLDVYEAYLTSELAHRQLVLLKKSLEEANELLRLADMRYSEGEIDFINFLDQVRTANQTRIKYYEGLFILTNAISRLEKAVYTSLRKEDYLK